MNPSIDDRLASVLTALREVILPEVSTSGGLGGEQVGLAIGHLELIRQQVDYAVRFEWLQHNYLTSFASTIIGRVSGGPVTVAARDALTLCLTQGSFPVQPRDIRSTSEAISAALSTLVGSSSVDGAPELQAYLGEVLLAYSERKALQDRAWFAGAGFEFNGVEFLPIPELIQQMETEAGGTS